MSTKFAEVYNAFLSKITDDMYIELTPEDTNRDLQELLLNSLTGFEFPRVNLMDYTLQLSYKLEEDVGPNDIVISWVWNDLEEDNIADDASSQTVCVDDSNFTATLSKEEIDILATLMLEGWVQRQVSSIEHTRMKFTGKDFSMTSQANHLAKLLSLLEEIQRQSLHKQRLYKRRKTEEDGTIKSNWSVLRHFRYLDEE